MASTRKTATVPNDAPNVDAPIVNDVPTIPADVVADVPTIPAIPVPVIDDTVIANYRAADRSGMAQIRSMLTNRMTAAIARGDLIGAMSANATMAECVADVAPVAVVIPAHITIAARAAAFIAAARMLVNGDIIPDGMDGAIDYAALSTEFDRMTTAPIAADNTDIIASARTMASAKITRVTTVNSVMDIIRAALTNDAPAAIAARGPFGFMSVANIRKFGNDESTGHITRDGAIAARLFPTNGTPNIPGFVAVDAIGNMVRGARCESDHAAFIAARDAAEFAAAFDAATAINDAMNSGDAATE